MTVEEAAAEIREHAAAGRAVRPRGGGTKLGWGGQSEATDFDTRRLNRILEHNEGDFTAILEAGVPLVEAQATFGGSGQMLALDPPLGAGAAATVGGVIAANDSGPMRHRYGGVRDVVVGITVVLSDGAIARSGGKVIKNVAGYDLAKLFAGSFGTLGLIARVALRLHPAPARTATVIARTDDPDALAGAAARLAALPLEADCLDAGWERDAGWLSRPLRRDHGGRACEGRARARRARRHHDRGGRRRAVGGAARPPARRPGREGLRPADRSARRDPRGARRRRQSSSPAPRSGCRGSHCRRAPTSPPCARRSHRGRAPCSTAPTACRTRGRSSIPACWP